MGIFERFKGKKGQQATPTVEVEKKPGLLEVLCGDDSLLYEDLSWTLYLDPRNKGTCAESMEKARALERESKSSEAARSYRHAGALAMYEGNPTDVKKAFDKAAELSDRKFERIRAEPEKAVEIATKFYDQTIKNQPSNP